MKTIYKLFLCLGLTLAFVPNLLAEFKSADYEESVVRVVSATGHGTGFFVNKDGYIITNAHVVESDGSFDDLFAVVHNYKGKTYVYKAKLHGKPSIEKDLAILKVSTSNAKPLFFANEDPLKGTKVYAIGFSGFNDNNSEYSEFFSEALGHEYSPENAKEFNEILSYIRDLNVKISNGEGDVKKNKEMREMLVERYSEIVVIEHFRAIKALKDEAILDALYASFAEPAVQEGSVEKIKYDDNWGLNDDATVKVIQHNAPTRGGNSGGPLMNAKGDFIAVHTASRRSDSGGAQLSSSSHYEELASYLNQNNVEFHYASKISDYLYIVYIVIGVVIVLGIFLVIILLAKTNASSKVSNAEIYEAPKNPVKNVSQTPQTPQSPAPEKDVSIRLEFKSPTSEIHKFSIDSKFLKANSNYIVLGRNGDFCDVCIDNNSLSGQHLGIRYLNSSLYLTDRNSTNSVFVDGKKIDSFTALKINNNSVIKIGDLIGSIKISN